MNRYFTSFPFYVGGLANLLRFEECLSDDFIHCSSFYNQNKPLSGTSQPSDLLSVSQMKRSWSHAPSRFGAQSVPLTARIERLRQLVGIGFLASKRDVDCGMVSDLMDPVKVSTSKRHICSPFTNIRSMGFIANHSATVPYKIVC